MGVYSLTQDLEISRFSFHLAHTRLALPMFIWFRSVIVRTNRDGFLVVLENIWNFNMPVVFME